MSPKSSNKCPYKRHTEEKQTEEEETDRGRYVSDAAMSQGNLVATRSQERQEQIVPGASLGSVDLMLWFGASLFLSKIAREDISAVLSHQTCGNFLEQPQENNM